MLLSFCSKILYALIGLSDRWVSSEKLSDSAETWEPVTVTNCTAVDGQHQLSLSRQSADIPDLATVRVSTLHPVPNLFSCVTICASCVDVPNNVFGPSRSSKTVDRCLTPELRILVKGPIELVSA